MAAARCLRWGLSRARAWLPPRPPHCPRRGLHKQVDGAGFQSIYSLDKLYPESRGSDTAWRVPVSRVGQAEGACPRLRGDVRKSGPYWPRAPFLAGAAAEGCWLPGQPREATGRG